MGLGTGEEEGYHTDPPGFIGWRNSFLGIDSGAPYTFKNTGSVQYVHMTSCHGDTTFLVVPSGLKTGRGPIDGRVTLSRCLYGIQFTLRRTHGPNIYEDTTP